MRRKYTFRKQSIRHFGVRPRSEWYVAIAPGFAGSGRERWWGALRNTAISAALFENAYGDYVRIKRGAHIAPGKSCAWRIAAALFYGKSGAVESSLCFATGRPKW